MMDGAEQEQRRLEATERKKQEMKEAALAQSNNLS